MEFEGFDYIELRAKVPLTFDPLPYVKVKKMDDVGMIVKPPYVVVDVDDEYQFQALYRMIEETGIKTRVMRTTRGGHFWFKTHEGISNQVGVNTPVSIRIDIRSHGRKSQVAVKQAGVWREWIQNDAEVDLLPQWLKPMKHEESFLGMTNGDGRNSKLFAYMITLVNAGLSRDDVRTTFNLINNNMFLDKLPQEELNVITRDASFENIREAFYTGRNFHHDRFSQYFVNDNKIFILNKRLYMYDKGYYSDDQHNINRRMIEYIPQLSSAQRREVMQYVELIAENPRDKSPYHIVCNNGMLDIRDDYLHEYDPLVITTNKINASYDENAYDEPTDNMLNRLCNNDTDLRLLLEEMIGYCLVPTAKFQKAFLLTGGGSNGKSTFLEMLAELLGNENVSALSMSELNHNFKVSEITSKLANIGDDISSEYMEDSSIFKKLVTGEDITVDVKNETPYKLKNTAKLIFAANDLPLALDKSEGLLRRLTIVPFVAKFSKNDEDYDPFISDKIKTDNARSYLLNIGLAGARRLFENNEFTEPLVVTDVLHEYEIRNNNAMAYYYDEIKTPEAITGKTLGDTYMAYQYWCHGQGMKPYSQIIFNKNIEETTGLIKTHVYTGGKQTRGWDVNPHLEVFKGGALS